MKSIGETKVFKAGRVFISQSGHWDIPLNIIPDRPQNIEEWETMGQSLISKP
jgi:hypothetical protein